MLRIHTQGKLHTTGIVELIGVLEEQMATFGLHKLERLYFVEFVVVVQRSTYSYELYAKGGNTMDRRRIELR